jgi:hypothetical protein
MEKKDRDFMKTLKMANKAMWNKEPADLGVVRFTPRAGDRRD